MIPIIVMLCAAVLYTILFFVFDFASTKYHLKKNQKEWDEIKATAIEVNPNKTFGELAGLYVDFCEEKGSYFPRF